MHQPVKLANRLGLLFAAAIVSVATLQYLQTAWFDYAWDDKLVITANEYTTRGIDGLTDIFTKRVSVPYKSEYRPIPQALYALEYEWFGANPAAGHAFNIFWYALACVLVFMFVRFVTVGTHAVFAFAVALLFTVHPLHVETVANIKGRDEILALLFGLSAIMLLVTAFERRQLLTGLAGGACFVFACLSKSNAVTLLPMAAVVAWYRAPGFGIDRRLAVATAGVAATAAAAATLIRYGQSTVSTDLGLHLNSTVLNNIFLWTTQPGTVVPTSLVNISRYLQLFVLPHPLIHLYGYDQIPLSRWSDAGPWLVIAGIAAVAIAAQRSYRSKPIWLFGLVWFALTFSVYSNLVFFAPDTMADRYLFIPSLGLCMIAVLALFRLGALDLRSPVPSGPRQIVAITLLAVALFACFGRSIVVSRDWQNDTTLITNRIEYMQRNAAAQAIYGHTLLRQSYESGSTAEALRLKQTAMAAFVTAIRIYPDFPSVWLAIGNLFGEQGIYDKAEIAFIKAQRLASLTPDSYLSLGSFYVAVGDHELAIPYLEKAVLLDPQLEQAYVMLGQAYVQAGATDNLGAMTETARDWFPDNVDVLALRAVYLFRVGDYAAAAEAASAVLAVSPQDVLAMGILSSPLLEQADNAVHDGR